MAKVEYWQLTQRQSLPLEFKIVMTKQRIKEWYEKFDGQVYVSFSGGKDSTVVLDLVREMYPDVLAVFIDTGLEYPEIRNFVKTIERVEFLRPDMPFKDVIEKYGYPVVSKEQAQFIWKKRNYLTPKMQDLLDNGNKWGRGKISKKWRFLIDSPFLISDRCCNVMKKNPVYKFEKKSGLKPYLGSMASESSKRVQDYLRFGCNSFDTKRQISRPIAFWKEEDVWEYLKVKNISYSSIYDMGYTRTGCMFCMFGVHLEKEPNRFQRMYGTHPKQWDFCMNNLGCAKVLYYIGVPYTPTKERI
jgi:3'-phosphoadenosine 5'-phosphosulfate sulfotransferase (PAPS reductase)/FAD synthetase